MSTKGKKSKEAQSEIRMFRSISQLFGGLIPRMFRRGSAIMRNDEVVGCPSWS
jgi:hypothetical protein